MFQSIYNYFSIPSIFSNFFIVLIDESTFLKQIEITFTEKTLIEPIFMIKLCEIHSQLS